MQEKWVSSTEAGRLLGCSSRTLRRYTAEGKLPDVRSEGGRRIFLLSEIEALKTSRTEKTVNNGIVVYARVSSHGQKAEGGLARQVQRLESHAGDKHVATFTDVASGLSDKRAGLKRVLTEATRGDVSTLLVTHRDRLARFGTRIIEHQLSLVGVQVVYLETDPVDKMEPAQEMVEDLVAIVTSFAGKLYGARSRKAKHLQEVVEEEVQDAA